MVTKLSIINVSWHEPPLKSVKNGQKILILEEGSSVIEGGVVSFIRGGSENFWVKWKKCIIIVLKATTVLYFKGVVMH